MKLVLAAFALTGWLVAAELGPEDPQVDQYLQLIGDFNASHILIAHVDAREITAGVTRDKKAAREKVDSLLAQLKEHPERFEYLASTESDAPSAAKAGYMGGWHKDQMGQSFEGKVNKLAVGEIADDAVTTDWGFHIVRRNPMWAKYYSGRMILLVHKDALILPGVETRGPALQRTREEAQKLAAELAQSVTAENFTEQHAAHADLKFDDKILNLFQPGDGYLGFLIARELEKVPYGQVSGVVDLPVGFAILKREKVQKVGHSRLRISYRGSRAAPPWIKRDRKEARLLAKDLGNQLEANPDQWDEVLKTHSNGPFAHRGGRVADWLVGDQSRTIQDAVLKLEIGGISPYPIKTPEGYHIYRREPLKPIEW